MSNGTKSGGIGSLLAEAKRRNVVRFVLGYAAAAFVVLQLAEIVFPAFGIGDDGLRVLVVLTCLGFVPALVLAWIYDLTIHGVERTDDDGSAGAAPSRLAITALVVITLAITGGLGLYLADQGVLSTTPSADPGPPTIGPVAGASYDPSIPIHSLAVLPLDDFSPSGDQAYFTLGMHEELVAKLSMLEDVRVVSRTTVMRYADPATRPSAPEIGRELGVDALVEGSVSRSDTQVRVTLQIIHAPSDSHIETLQWERDTVEDLLAFQTEIAQAVAEEIASEDRGAIGVTRTASTDPRAQELYLRGRAAYAQGTPEGYRNALDYFEEAVAADTAFAAAKAGAAGARFLVGLDEPAGLDTTVREQIALARQEALAALAMDSTSMEAKEVLVFINRTMPALVGPVADVEAPEPADPARIQVFGESDSLDPITIDMGAFDTTWVDAITALGERIEARVRDRALGLRELSPRGRRVVEAGLLMNSGRYPDAVRALERLVDEDPDDLAPWDMLVRSKMAMRDVDGAVDVVRRWYESGASNAPDAQWVARLERAVETDGERGFWEWRLDRLTMHLEAGRDVPRVELAAARAALGDDDEALDLLSEALERGEPGLLSLRSDPVWDDLRGDRRFRLIARQAQRLRFGTTPPREGG